MVAPRRLRFYAQRVVFVLVLFSLVCTAWALMAGIQHVRNLGDLARFGGLVFQIVVPLELIVAMFLSATAAASNVSQEKDRRTLILLLLTRLTGAEIVLGKLMSTLVGVGNLVFSALPLLLLIAILGGVSSAQVFASMAIILVTAAWTGALANLVAFWREKTFQTLAITLLAIVGWLAFCEAVAAGSFTGVDPSWAELLSPVRALWGVCQPIGARTWSFLPGGIAAAHCLLGVIAGILFSAIAIWRLRAWNPSQQVRPQAPEPDENYAVSSTVALTDARSIIDFASAGLSDGRHLQVLIARVVKSFSFDGRCATRG